MADALDAALDDNIDSSVLRARGEEFSVDQAVNNYNELFSRLVS